jgi:hypothetical protein
MCGENFCNVFLMLFMLLFMGSYLLDALWEGSAEAVACLPAPRAGASGGIFLLVLFLFALWFPLLFRVRSYVFFNAEKI